MTPTLQHAGAVRDRWNEQPTIAVVHLPGDQGMRTAAGQAAAARTFAAAHRAGHLAVADYANTHNPKLVSQRRPDDVGADRHAESRRPARQRRHRPDRPALRAGRARGLSSVDVTGFEQLQTSAGGGGGGPSVLVETPFGAVGALAVLLFVFASRSRSCRCWWRRSSILTTFLLVLPLTYADRRVVHRRSSWSRSIGLGVAIDYSLLFVTRWREERDHGRDNHEARRRRDGDGRPRRRASAA